MIFIYSRIKLFKIQLDKHACHVRSTKSGIGPTKNKNFFLPVIILV